MIRSDLIAALRRILKRTGDRALAEIPQRGLLGQFQVPTICVGQSHLFRCATIRFEHHRGGDQNTEALRTGSGISYAGEGTRPRRPRGGRELATKEDGA
jgi:hypothetical protein